MKKFFLKKDNGFVASDAYIAMLIIIIFSVLISTISYNIYLANSSLKKSSAATSYIIDVFEHANRIKYENVTKEVLTQYFNSKYYYLPNSSIPRQDAEASIGSGFNTPFKITLDVVKYNETEGNTSKQDLIKKITMTVRYRVGNKEKKIEMTTIKKREI